jgi:hypothetical protein
MRKSWMRICRPGCAEGRDEKPESTIENQSLIKSYP